MTVSFYLKYPSETESLIVARIMWQNYQLPYSTKKKVKTEYWVSKNKSGSVQRVKETNRYPEYSGINQALVNIKTDITNIFNRYTNEHNQHEPTKEELKQLLHAYHDRGKAKASIAKEPTVLEYLDQFISRSEKGLRVQKQSGQALSPNTIKTYRTLKGHLAAYTKTVEKPLTWDQINIQFHQDYSEFLMDEFDLSNNSIGKDFSTIKLLCSEAYYSGINKYDQFNNPLFKVSREESFSIHLSDQEINTLWNLDLTYNKSLEETRDLFILGCEIGQRFSDYSDIKPNQIRESRIYIKQVKTGKRVECVLPQLSKKILVKYKNHLPNGGVNQAFNRRLKEICENVPEFKEEVEINYSKAGKRIIELKPKYELITSHTARRSFATNEVHKNTPVPLIMSQTGHTTEKSFWKYVKLSPSHNADALDEVMKKREAAIFKVA